jgi:single-strand DNA-binding protein
VANFYINKTILGGRLTSDVELKQTQSGLSVCSFTIAVNRKFAKEGEQQTDFINCVAWRKTAEIIAKFFKKGSSIVITGEIQVRSWQDQNGQKRYATEVVADDVYFVDSKSDVQSAETSSPSNYIPDAYKTPQTANFEPISEDNDLPF